MMVPNRDTMKLANYKLNLKIQFHRVNYVIYTVNQYYAHCSLTHQKLSKAPSSTPSTLPPPPPPVNTKIISTITIMTIFAR